MLTSSKMTSLCSESTHYLVDNCAPGECNCVATIWLLCPDAEQSRECRQKQFVSITELDFHIQLHHRRLPKQCPVNLCPISCLTREELVHHVSTEHRTGCWPCRHCSSSFSACRGLFHHIFLFHEPGFFKCQQQGCEFSSNICRQDVLKHFMTVHESLDSLRQNIAGRPACMCRQLIDVNPAFQKQHQQSNSQIHALQSLSSAAQSQSRIASPERMFAAQKQVPPHEQQQRFPVQMLSNVQIQPFNGTAQQQQHQRTQIPQMHQLYSQFVNSMMVTPQQQMQHQQFYLNQIEHNKQMHQLHGASQPQHYMTQSKRFMVPFQMHHQRNQNTAAQSLQMNPLFGLSQSQQTILPPVRHSTPPQCQNSQLIDRQMHQLFQDASRIQSSQPLVYVTRPNTIQPPSAHSRNSAIGSQVYGRPRGKCRSNGRILQSSLAHSSSNMITSQQSNYLALAEHSLSSMDLPFEKDNPLLLQLVERMSANNPNGLQFQVHTPSNSVLTQNRSHFPSNKKSKQSSVHPKQLSQMSPQNQQASASGPLVLPLLQSHSLSNSPIQNNPIACNRESEMGLLEYSNVRIFADYQCHPPVFFSKRSPNTRLNCMEQRHNYNLSSFDASPMVEVSNQTAISTSPIVRSSLRVSSRTNFFDQATSQMTSMAHASLSCQTPGSMNHCNPLQIASKEIAVMATPYAQIRNRPNNVVPSQQESDAMKFSSLCLPVYQPGITVRRASAGNLTSSQSKLLLPHCLQTNQRKCASVNVPYSIPEHLISDISDTEGTNEPSNLSIPSISTTQESQDASMQGPSISANADYCVEPVSKPHDDGHVMLRFFKKSKMDSTVIQAQGSATEQPRTSSPTGIVSAFVSPQTAVCTSALNTTSFTSQIEGNTETLSNDSLLEIGKEQHEKNGLVKRSFEVNTYQGDSQDEETLENGKLIIVEQIEESIDGTLASGAEVDNTNSPPQFDRPTGTFSKIAGTLSGKTGVVFSETEERDTNEIMNFQVNSGGNGEMETSDIFFKKLLLDLRRDIVRKSTVSVSMYLAGEVRDSNNNDFSFGSELATENKENSPMTESLETMTVSRPFILPEDTIQANLLIPSEFPTVDLASSQCVDATTNSNPGITEHSNDVVSESGLI